MRKSKSFGDSAGSLITKILLVVVVIILIGAAVAATYVYQQHRINTLKSQNSDLKSQVQSSNSSKTKNGASQTTKSNPRTFTSSKGVKVKVYAPAANGKVASPVGVIGEVPGNWSFEGSFPIILQDSQGNPLAMGTAHLQGNSTTSKLVPFSAQLTYTGSRTGTGKLVLQKSNPSNQPQNNDSVTIPISF